MALNITPVDDEKLVKIRIRERDYGGKGYFPRWAKWPKHPQDKSTPIKLSPGDEAELPVQEAKDLIKRGIAERADEFPGD